MPRLQKTKTTLGDNYRITIPRKMVEKVGWEKGDNIKIDERDGYLILFKQ